MLLSSGYTVNRSRIDYQHNISTDDQPEKFRAKVEGEVVWFWCPFQTALDIWSVTYKVKPSLSGSGGMMTYA